MRLEYRSDHKVQFSIQEFTSQSSKLRVSWRIYCPGLQVFIVVGNSILKKINLWHKSV